MGITQSGLNYAVQLSSAGWKRLLPIAGAGILGVGAATWAGVNWARTSRDVDEAQRQNQAARDSYETVRADTDRLIDEYGERMARAMSDTVERFAVWLERNQQNANLTDVAGSNAAPGPLPSIVEFSVLAHDYARGLGLLGGVVGNVGSGRAGVMWGVQAFARASTGTPIADLDGAAATRAIMAWLGGGAKAVGGGGMVVGEVVLQLASILPRVIVFGAAASLGSVASSAQGRRIIHELDAERDRIGEVVRALGIMQQRIEGLKALLLQREGDARTALEHLDTLEFDVRVHEADLLEAVRAINLVIVTLNTPVVDAASPS